MHEIRDYRISSYSQTRYKILHLLKSVLLFVLSRTQKILAVMPQPLMRVNTMNVYETFSEKHNNQLLLFLNIESSLSSIQGWGVSSL